VHLLLTQLVQEAEVVLAVEEMPQLAGPQHLLEQQVLLAVLEAMEITQPLLLVLHQLVKEQQMAVSHLHHHKVRLVVLAARAKLILNIGCNYGKSICSYRK
jgi:hypothetical protein